MKFFVKLVILAAFFALLSPCDFANAELRLTDTGESRGNNVAVYVNGKFFTTTAKDAPNGEYYMLYEAIADKYFR